MGQDNFRAKLGVGAFRQGFTLIELIVAVGVFSVVVVVAVGALFSAQNTNTRVQQTQMILDGMNLSMEVMTRDIRYGRIFHCGSTYNEVDYLLRKSCPFSDLSTSVPGTAVVFQPARSPRVDDRVAYYLLNNKIMKWSIDTAHPLGYVEQVTADDVKIETLHFFVNGAHSVTGSSDVSWLNDTYQPSISIVISGVTKPPRANVLPVRFKLQTNVTSRMLDN